MQLTRVRISWPREIVAGCWPTAIEYPRVSAGPGYSVSTYDLTDATLSEARTWAEDEAGDRMYSIALVSSNEQGHRGLIWLIGDDANDVLDQAPTEARQRVQSRPRQEMIENRLRRN